MGVGRSDVEREGTAGPAFLQLRAEGKERPGEGKLYLLCILLRAQAETFWLFFGLKNKGTEVPTPRVFLMFYFLNYLLIYLFLAVLGLRSRACAFLSLWLRGASHLPRPSSRVLELWLPGSRAQARYL